MVCIASFIILALIGIFVAIISIFKPKVGKAYLKAMKKAWGCLWKKVRLQKCETGFKDDVKNTLLSRVMLKHPGWVRPLSIVIEFLSIVIVVVAVWALLTAIKSLLALWALGNCNVTKPSACTMGAEMCSIDEDEPKNVFEATGRWFTEWGEIFEAIPDKFRTYNIDDYGFSYIVVGDEDENKKTAVDIFDPGCSVCMTSYKNQKTAGFFENNNVRLVPFAIQGADDSYKFKNSEVVVRYMYAANKIKSEYAVTIIDKIYTGKNHDNYSYQDLINDDYSKEDTVKHLESWLRNAGATEKEIEKIRGNAESQEITDTMARNRQIVENELKVKGIPTMLYDGKKHTGLWKAE